MGPQSTSGILTQPRDKIQLRFLIHEKMLEITRNDYQKPLKSWGDKLKDFRHFLEIVQRVDFDKQRVKNEYYSLLDVDTRQMIYNSAEYRWDNIDKNALRMHYARELVKPRQMTPEKELDQKDTKSFFAFIIEISGVSFEELKKIIDIVAPKDILKLDEQRKRKNY